MNESKLRSALTKSLTKELPRAKVLRHEDKYTAGIPDLSVTWRGYTIWLEVKYAKNSLKRGKAIQQYTTNWLMQQGLCWYIIYRELNPMFTSTKENDRQIIILDPKNIYSPSDWATLGDLVVPGFDHKAVAQFIRRYHDGNNG